MLLYRSTLTAIIVVVLYIMICLYGTAGCILGSALNTSTGLKVRWISFCLKNRAKGCVIETHLLRMHELRKLGTQVQSHAIEHLTHQPIVDNVQYESEKELCRYDTCDIKSASVMEALRVLVCSMNNCTSQLYTPRTVESSILQLIDEMSVSRYIDAHRDMLFLSFSTDARLANVYKLQTTQQNVNLFLGLV